MMESLDVVREKVGSYSRTVPATPSRYRSGSPTNIDHKIQLC